METRWACGNNSHEDMTVEINFIPESVLLCYNHHANNPLLTRAHSYCHHFPFQCSTQVISTKTPVYMLLFCYISHQFTHSHIKPDSQMVQSTAFSQSEEEENLPWRRMAESIIHIHFFPSSCLSLSLFYSCLSHHLPFTFAFFPFRTRMLSLMPPIITILLPL